jgi:hypothetical protein
MQDLVPRLTRRTALGCSQGKLSGLPLDRLCESTRRGPTYFAMQCDMGFITASLWLEATIPQALLQITHQLLQGFRGLTWTAPENPRPGPVAEGIKTHAEDRCRNGLGRLIDTGLLRVSHLPQEHQGDVQIVWMVRASSRRLMLPGQSRQLIA